MLTKMRSKMEIKNLKNSIDIIVPSYRLNIDFLIPILSLKKPFNWKVNCIIIADNPKINIPKELDAFLESGTVSVISNLRNLGAPESRNKGIEIAKNEWLLFFDDDIIPNNDILFQYINAINQYSNPIQGFVGVTKFPESFNSFTKGVVASDILTFFSLAENYKEMSWGVTANLMIKREAIGSLRFLRDFPKFGGGEDIDICLNVVSKVHHKFKTIPDAIVHHPWWDNRIVAYKRFFRWAFGDSQLPKLHPKYRYFNFPNVIESLFIGLIIGSFIYFFTNNSLIYIPLLAGIIVGEVIAEWIKLYITKKEKSPIIALESAAIRAFNDLGRLTGNLKRKRLHGIFERFDYFCDGKHIKSERKWGFLKCSLYLFFINLFFKLIIS